MFDEISDHGVPDDKISFGAGGDGKGIYIYIYARLGTIAVHTMVSV